MLTHRTSSFPWQVQYVRCSRFQIGPIHPEWVLYWQLHALDALRELNGIIIWAQAKIHRRRFALCLQQNPHISGGGVIQCLDQYNLDVGVSVWLSCHPPPSTSTIWSRHPYTRFTTAMADIMDHLHELSHITHQCAWGEGKICTYCHSSS